MTQFSGTELICYRGGRTVFRGLKFTVAPGAALVLVGPNGSGKSSLLRLMAGLLQPTSGTIAWGGEPISEEPELHNQRIQYVGHQTCIKPVLTVSENLGFWSGIHGGGTDLILEALEMFDIGHLIDVPGQFLSAGQKQRVNLARILASPTKLWLLDEPTTALDVSAISKLEQAIEQHRQNGNMVVLSTHSGLNLSNTITLNLGQYAVGWEEL